MSALGGGIEGGLLGFSPAIRGSSIVPDTATPAPAPPGVQNLIEKIRSELADKAGRKFTEFAASLYIKKSNEYVVKVAGRTTPLHVK